MNLRTRASLAAAAVLALAAAAIPAPAHANPDTLLTPPANPVTGRYVIVLDDTVPAAQVPTVAAALAGSRSSVAVTYRHALKGFAARINAAQARKIANDPRVAAVIQDGRVKAYGDKGGQVGAQATQPIPAPPNTYWGLNRIDQRPLPPNAAGAYNYWFSGAGTHIYVIDTGVRTSHTDFGGRASFDFAASGIGGGPVDCNGHGTHVAGTAAGGVHGVAYAARIHAVKVLDCGGSGLYSQVIQGVDWVTGNAARPAVANMSLGGGAFMPLDVAVNNSIEAGITYTLAAGNSADDACEYSPARTLAAITVASTGNFENPSAPISDGRSSFSNYGQCVDLFAPGAYIRSAWHTSDSATNTISGTSMAAPHVAGVAALFLQRSPAAAPTAVRNGIVSWSTKGKVVNPGTGSPNRLLFSGTTSTLTANATPEPVLKGRTVTTKGYLKAEGVGLANRTVSIFFNPVGPAGEVLKGTDVTDSTGFYTRAFPQSVDGTWVARYAGAPLLAASAASDYVDCSNC